MFKNALTTTKKKEKSSLTSEGGYFDSPHFCTVSGYLVPSDHLLNIRIQIEDQKVPL